RRRRGCDSEDLVTFKSGDVRRTKADNAREPHGVGEECFAVDRVERRAVDEPGDRLLAEGTNVVQGTVDVDAVKLVAVERITREFRHVQVLSGGVQSDEAVGGEAEWIDQ